MLDNLLGSDDEAEPMPVVGMAVDTVGLRICTADAADMSAEAFKQGRTIPLFDAADPLAESRLGNRAIHEALADGEDRLLMPDLDEEITVDIRPGFGDLLERVHEALASASPAWDGETVLSVPPYFASSAGSAIQQSATDAGFDVVGSVPTDAVDGVIETFNTPHGELPPKLVVTLGYDRTTISLLQCTPSEGRVRVANRATYDVGNASADLLIAMELLEEEYNIPKEEQAPQMLTFLRPEIYEQRAVDDLNDVTDSRVAVEIDGEARTLPVPRTTLISWLTDFADNIDLRARGVVAGSGYAADDIEEVSLTGLGAQGPTRTLMETTVGTGLSTKFGKASLVTHESGSGPELGAAYFGAISIDDSSNTLSVYE